MLVKKLVFGICRLPFEKVQRYNDYMIFITMYELSLSQEKI